MNPTQMTDAQRIARVKEVVLQASDNVRRKYPILKHQDAIGATIMIVSLLGMIPWWLLPFQLFCFNFGSTHAIHHFVVKEAFYTSVN